MSIARLMQMAAAGAGGEYQISRSLRFNSADSAYLSRTPASASNRKTWTWSGWVKKSAISDTHRLFEAGTSGTDVLWFGFVDQFVIQEYTGGGFTIYITSDAVYRDVSAWMHIVVAVDTAQATNTNRIKIYINNSQLTSFTSTSYPSQNLETKVNTTNQHTIGGSAVIGGSSYFNGYMTEINFIDGQALTPSSFGETNETTGVWSPIAYAGSYGTNGFYLNFSDNSGVTATTLGKDQAGSNNWTPNNFSVTAGAGNDSLVDTPTQYGTDTGAGGQVRGNYCTYNPIGLGGGTLSNGNLTLVVASGTTPAVGTFAMTTGKWYWEVTLTTSSGPRVGVFDVGSSNPAGLGETAFGWAIINSPSRTFHNNSTTSYGTFNGNNGDVVMLAYDADAGKLWYGVNGSFFASGNPATGANPSQSSVTGNAIVPANGFGGGSSNTHNANFGQRPFAYTAPSGFKALVTTNLPEPTVVQGDDYFNTVLWTGDATNPRSISGVGFQPDLVWIKTRSVANPNLVHDAVRGVTSTDSRSLRTEATDGEVNYYTVNGALNAFESDGFRLAGGSTNNNYNASGGTFVAWNWKANGAGSVNELGTISSTVSANTIAGISIVTYTGNGTAGATVGHGLGATPAFVIFKDRGATSDWRVWTTLFGTGNALSLNSTAGTGSNSAVMQATPTSTLMYLLGSGYSVNNSGNTYVAYCFAEVEGFSKFGSYTGNGSTDGVFVYTGFRPAFVLYKDTNATNNWEMIDATRNPHNVANGRLFPSASSAESTSENTMDLLSNGFKFRDTYGGGNASGINYIYMAFAENPFKYSLAR
jgi:hypothetical protein